MMHIHELVEEAHSSARVKGFYDQPQPLGVSLMKVVAEAVEAFEADKKGEGPDRIAEELADVIILTAGICAELKVDLERAIRRKMEINAQRPRLHGKRY